MPSEIDSEPMGLNEWFEIVRDAGPARVVGEGVITPLTNVMLPQHFRHIRAIIKAHPDMIPLIDFAIKVHDGQVRKDKVTPFIAHPLGILRWTHDQVSAMPYNYRVISMATAVGHDTMEDGMYKSRKVRATDLLDVGFPPAAVAAIIRLSKLDHSATLDDYRRRIMENGFAVFGKIGDLINNLSGFPSSKKLVEYTDTLKIMMDCFPTAPFPDEDPALKARLEWEKVNYG
jgi:hypothetical protein